MDNSFAITLPGRAARDTAGKYYDTARSLEAAEAYQNHVRNFARSRATAKSASKMNDADELQRLMRETALIQHHASVGLTTRKLRAHTCARVGRQPC
jgi:hypothetical protein